MLHHFVDWDRLGSKISFYSQHKSHQKRQSDETRSYNEHWPGFTVDQEPHTREFLRSLAPSWSSFNVYLLSFVPCVRWLPKYNLYWLLGDTVAGVTVGAVLLPQAIAYADLATLPVEAGCYAAFAGSILCFVSGNSKDINVGPITVATIITGRVIDQVHEAVPGAYTLALAQLIAFFVGITFVLLSVLRLGRLVNLISLPATAAFITGRTIIAIVGRIPSLLGIKGIPRDGAPFLLFVKISKSLAAARIDAAIGITSLLLLFSLKIGIKNLNKSDSRYSKILFYVSCMRMVFTILLYIFISFLSNQHRLDNPAYEILGFVPRDFQQITKPEFNRDMVMQLLPRYPLVLIVILVEHISTAKSFGRRNNYTINPNSELLALGSTNILSSVLGGFAISGSLSRTMINSEASVRTPLSGVVSAALIVVAIYGLTPMLYYIPTATLSAVVIHAVWDLITPPSTIFHCWRVSPVDALIFCTGLTLILFVSGEIELYILIALPFIVHVGRMSLSKGQILHAVKTLTLRFSSETDVTGQQPSDQDEKVIHLPTKMMSKDRAIPTLRMPHTGVFVYRPSSDLCFLNAAPQFEHLVSNVKAVTCDNTPQDIKKRDLSWGEAMSSRQKLTLTAGVGKPALRAVIVHLTNIDNIDMTTIQALSEARTILGRYATPDEVQWHFAGVHSPWSRRALFSAGFGSGNQVADDFAKQRWPVVLTAIKPDVESCRASETEDVERKDWNDKSHLDDIESHQNISNQMDKSNQQNSVEGGHATIIIYAVNRPYFHVDLESALSAATIPSL